MKQGLGKLWRLFVNLAAVFSFAVNLALILVIVVAIGPLRQLLSDLDQAFLGLADADVHAQVPVDQPIDIRFDQALSQPLDLKFDLTIEQETTAVLIQDTTIVGAPIEFNLGPFGQIKGTGTITLPGERTRLPVRLNMVVPVSKTIDVEMTVPVSQSVPLSMTIPVGIQLGDAGLDPAVERLRAVFSPLHALASEADGALDRLGIR